MSDMLAQAIVDATALKEAAVKNAENLVLEKYSNQIKDAVETLLEQEDPMAGMPGMEDPMAAAEPPAGAPDAAAPAGKPSPVLEHIPLAVTSQDPDEEVEIPLEGLMEQITKLSETLRFDGNFIDDPDIHNNVALEVVTEDLAAIMEQDDDDDDDEPNGPSKDGKKTLHGEGDTVVLDEEDFGPAAEELEEAIRLALSEELIVDLPGNNKSGWAGTPKAMVELAEEEILALEKYSVTRERNSAIRKAVKELQAVNEGLIEQNKQFKVALKESKNNSERYKSAILNLKEKLDEVNLMNAKLLYQNKALNSTSLNERQKHKLVEAVTSAETIEEAKVIFETLESTVGSTSRKKQPESLREAVEKSSSMILSNRKRDTVRQKANPTYDRWKSLAGLKTS